MDPELDLVEDLVLNVAVGAPTRPGL